MAGALPSPSQLALIPSPPSSSGPSHGFTTQTSYYNNYSGYPSNPDHYNSHFSSYAAPYPPLSSNFRYQSSHISHGDSSSHSALPHRPSTSSHSHTIGHGPSTMRNGTSTFQGHSPNHGKSSITGGTPSLSDSRRRSSLTDASDSDVEPKAPTNNMNAMLVSRSRTGRPPLALSSSGLGRVCESCGTTDSPEWRRGPSGHRSLCNKCGLRYYRSVRRKGETMKNVSHSIK